MGRVRWLEERSRRRVPARQRDFRMVPKRAAASELQNTQGQNERAKHRREEQRFREKSTSNPTTRANGNERRELAALILTSKATGQTFDRIRLDRVIVALRKARSLKPIFQA